MKKLSYLCSSAAIFAGLLFLAGCKDRTKDTPSKEEKRLALSDNTGDKGVGLSQQPFAYNYFYIEYNATAEDAGVQVSLDGDGWKEVQIFAPNNEKILEVKTEKGLQALGITELKFESREPSLEEVLELFPPGTYMFRGATLDGKKLAGEASFTHQIPKAPVFSPSKGETVDLNRVIITWEAVPGIAKYEVVVMNPDLAVSMHVELASTTTSLQVPPTFLKPNTEYNVEVIAILDNGNRTITEGQFKTLP